MLIYLNAMMHSSPSYSREKTMLIFQDGIFDVKPFFVQANDSEIPLLHEYNGTVKEAGSTLEVGLQKISHVCP
jgi:hypothetical protein